MADHDPTHRTRAAARILGPYLIIAGAMLIVRAPDMALLLPAFMQDGPLVLLAGAFTTIAGLTLLSLHHHFNSPPAIVITLIAIGATLKGAWLLIAPQLGAPLTAAVVRSPFLTIVAVLLLIVGAWLSFVGWSAARKGTS
jgi:hypothetical protein